jgi:hypothetical protein
MALPHLVDEDERLRFMPEDIDSGRPLDHIVALRQDAVFEGHDHQGHDPRRDQHRHSHFRHDGLQFGERNAAERDRARCPDSRS